MARTTKIEKGSMGCYLNPPGHPEYYFHVATDLDRHPNHRGSSSLLYALKSEFVEEDTKNGIRALLNIWEKKEKPSTDSEEFVNWVREVTVHFSSSKERVLEFVQCFYSEIDENNKVFDLIFFRK